MSQYILTLNCGSSSIKFALIEPNKEKNVFNGLVERIGGEHARIKWRFHKDTVNEKKEAELGAIDYQDALDFIIKLLDKTYHLRQEIFAIGHRVVHGGEHFTAATVINKKTLQAITKCVNLAPLHNPANILGIKAAQKALPGLPQVAVFDTAFHQSMPKHAYIYPIPYEYYEKYGARRYGFHGTSHKFVVSEAAQLLNKNLQECSFLSAHLGNGCSATAVKNGKSLDTTMGLTPLEGLMMGTRSGDIDPSLHSYLAKQLGVDVHEVTNILNKKSGLLGVSGKASDMRAIEEAIQSGDERAKLAAEIFCYRLAKQLAALAVPLGKVDALLFTGGIGENSDFIRAKTLDWLKVFGFSIDHERNQKHGHESRGIITKEGTKPVAMVVPTNEELMIAKETSQLVSAKK